MLNCSLNGPYILIYIYLHHILFLLNSTTNFNSNLEITLQDDRFSILSIWRYMQFTGMYTECNILISLLHFRFHFPARNSRHIYSSPHFVLSTVLYIRHYCILLSNCFKWVSGQNIFIYIYIENTTITLCLDNNLPQQHYTIKEKV